MNLFRNKFVVIGLGALALVMLYRSLSPIWQRGRSPARTKSASAPAQPKVATPAPAPVVSTPPPSGVQLKTEGAPPERSIDLTQVGWSVDGPPRRDPFQVIGPGTTNLARLYPPVAELLALSAIWRQTGSSLAVINSRIVGEGDTLAVPLGNQTGDGAQNVLRYTIESIGGDSIWLQGPAGREQLEFGPIIPAQTNTTAKALR